MSRLSDTLENPKGDVVDEFDDGLYTISDRDYFASPLAVIRAVTQGLYSGWRIIKAKNAGKVTIDLKGPHGLKMLASGPALLAFEGINFINGSLTIAQPDVAFLWCDGQFSPTMWSAQAAGYKNITISTTSGSNIVRGAAGTFTGQNGHYLVCGAAGLPNGKRPVNAAQITAVNGDGSQATLNRNATSTKTNAAAIVGGPPEDGYYSRNRMIEGNFTTNKRLRTLACDWHDTGTIYMMSGSSDGHSQGCRLFNPTDPPFDPIDVLHSDCMSFAGKQGTHRHTMEDFYAYGRVLLEDYAEPSGSSGNSVDSMFFDRGWFGSDFAELLFCDSLAGPGSPTRGIFGHWNDIVSWTAQGLNQRIDQLWVDATSSVKGDTTPPWNELDIKRINFAMANWTRRTTPPVAVPLTDPANPANIYRAANPHNDTVRNAWMGWKPPQDHPGPTSPRVGATAANTTNAQSLSVTFPAGTVAGSTLVVAVAGSNPGVDIVPPVGAVTLASWDIPAAAHVEVYRVAAAGGVQTVGPFVQASGTMAAMGIEVQGADPAAPVDAIATPTTGGPGTTHTAPGAGAAGRDNELALAFIACDNFGNGAIYSAPTNGYTLDGEAQPTAGLSTPTIAVCHLDDVTVGTSSPGVALTSSISQEFGGVGLLFQGIPHGTEIASIGRIHVGAGPVINAPAFAAFMGIGNGLAAAMTQVFTTDGAASWRRLDWDTPQSSPNGPSSIETLLGEGVRKLLITAHGHRAGGSLSQPYGWGPHISDGAYPKTADAVAFTNDWKVRSRAVKDRINTWCAAHGSPLVEVCFELANEGLNALSGNNIYDASGQNVIGKYVYAVGLACDGIWDAAGFPEAKIIPTAMMDSVVTNLNSGEHGSNVFFCPTQRGSNPRTWSATDFVREAWSNYDSSLGQGTGTIGTPRTFAQIRGPAGQRIGGANIHAYALNIDPYTAYAGGERFNGIACPVLFIADGANSIEAWHNSEVAGGHNGDASFIRYNEIRQAKHMARFMREAAAAAGWSDSDKETYCTVWNTEWGYADATQSESFVADPNVAATYVTHHLNVQFGIHADADGVWLNGDNVAGNNAHYQFESIEMTNWFLTNDVTGTWTYGLFHADGSSKPMYTAWKAFSQLTRSV